MFNVNNWFLLSIIAGICFGLMITFVKIATKELSALMITSYIFLFVTVMLWSYILLTKNSFMSLSQNTLIILFVASVFSVVGNIALFTAYHMTPNPGYAAALSSIRMLVALIAGFIIFAVRPNFYGITGVFLIFSGVLLLSMVN